MFSVETPTPSFPTNSFRICTYKKGSLGGRFAIRKEGALLAGPDAGGEGLDGGEAEALVEVDGGAVLGGDG